MSGISLSRTTVLTVVSVIEVAVVLFFAARWYSRRWGWRSTFGRVRDYVRVTFADLLRPMIQLYRFGQNVRLIAAQLSDPELGGVLRSAGAGAAARLAGEPDCWPYAALLSRTTVTLAMTQWRRVEPAAPWENQDGWWSAPRPKVAPGPADPIPDVPIGHVAIGAENGVLTLLDLVRVPGVVEVTGPDRPVASLICAVAAQLSSGLTAFEEMDVVVAAGLHPRFAGPSPLAVLRHLDEQSRSAAYQHRFTVLLCGPLSAAESDLLTSLVPRLPLLRVMLAGPYAGRRWRLPITETGRIEAPELGLFTDSAPVERGVGRTLKLRAKQFRPIAARPSTRLRAPAGHPVEPDPATAPVRPVSPGPSGGFVEPVSAPATSRSARSVADGYAGSPQAVSQSARSTAGSATSPHDTSGQPATYSDDAYAPPPAAVRPAAPARPNPATAPQIARVERPATLPTWDLDEPEPDASEPAGHSAASAAARNGRDAQNGADQPARR